mmetsp:Transcript_34455/g.103923  ORF Transcript_34455/g.103923 Transcript_34455/m.103923 type:complete len:195 (-) Transcript_34455:109-693(-)|eukprot:CAMPEP_0206292698 /NCGR_PEP_ID=MMETSP0106_2-20121207/3762_1 /ASSEMBLY_ACC=CAM_ASM_000206 /TAXON_ID=81532 /ORGANISM="Acanthoeca-like sp., Strain 10tr" /LENGTH=194 /DNA_ID=CAMNT_0053723283 /DNA_START=191 /DNA_END=775 /DNA_ORIENTATION=+
MFICIGPLCVPLWGVLPFLLIVYKWLYKWVTGKEYETVGGEQTEWADAVATAAANFTDDEAAQSGHADDKAAADCELRHRSAVGAALPTITTTDEWIQTLARSKVTDSAVVVKFTASWCRPCKVIAPHFERLATESAGAVFVNVDADAAADVFKASMATALPTFQVYRGSLRTASLTGADEAKLTALVKEYVTK